MERQQMMELLLKELRTNEEEILAKLDANKAKTEAGHKDLLGKKE
jgi:hypothetical protein